MMFNDRLDECAKCIVTQDRTWHTGERLELAQALLAKEAALTIAKEALAAIVGPADSGLFIDAYRLAGGGYGGLQRIASDALAQIDQAQIKEGT